MVGDVAERVCLVDCRSISVIEFQVTEAVVEDGPSVKKEGPTLSIGELSVGFGGLLALDHVSMSADQGEIVGVIGPNGAGKTTLFNVICGFVRADSGSITYDGVSLRSSPSTRPDQARDRPHAPGRRTLWRADRSRERDGRRSSPPCERHRIRLPWDLALESGGAPRGCRRSRTARQLGVGGYAHQLPATLPYAIQKRTALARALIAEPEPAPARRAGQWALATTRWMTWRR